MVDLLLRYMQPICMTPVYDRVRSDPMLACNGSNLMKQNRSVTIRSSPVEVV
jgi:hypothetical protein